MTVENVAWESRKQAMNIIKTESTLKVYYIAPHFEAPFAMITMAVINILHNVAIKSYTKK